jgi:precorrin-6B methylase 2
VAFPHALATHIAPALKRRSARLERPRAAFLDIGMAAAAMAVEMARLWPELRVLGIDRSAPARSPASA